MAASAQPSTYPEPVDYYQKKAEQSEDLYERNDYLLKVAGRLIQESTISRAQQQLNALTQLTPEQQNEKNILNAKIALLKQHPQQALRFASKIAEPTTLPAPLQSFYHQILASSYHLKGEVINEISQLIELDNFQQIPEHKLATRQKIWQSISKLPLEKEKVLTIDAQGEIEGWLALNLAVRENRDNSDNLLAAIQAWKSEHPNHPANNILISTSNNQSLTNRPNHLALLLPLSGDLKGPGQAIRDGFMSAYFESKQKGATLRFYDTDAEPANVLYKRAIENGAELVIGPLTKQNVKEISLIAGQVPTIALNEVESVAANNFYQFSIDPQNEATQLAYKVFADGYKQALVIAPEGSWGESIAQNFISQWTAQGGNVTDTFYFNDKTDMDKSISHLLDISDSQERKNELVRTIWKRPKFFPRRRQDFDVIVLLSYASKARQIRPMLKYYYASNIPIYGTSLLYSGTPNAQFDSDLNGVIFSEMPYLFDTKNTKSKTAWPEQYNSYNRLYALGKDAYLLSYQLNQLKLFPMMGVQDNTGTLFIGQNGKIQRQLEWAKFRNGKIEPLLGKVG